MLSEDTGRELLDEMLQMALSEYNSAGVNVLRRELDFVKEKLESLKQRAEQTSITQELSIHFALLKAYKERNERIFRAYGFNRLLKIMANYFIKSDIKRLLSAQELKFDSEYTILCEAYLSEYSHLDLMDREPPLNFYVQVVTLEDCGVILNGDELIDLKKDRLYFLRKTDFVYLISAKLVKLL